MTNHELVRDMNKHPDHYVISFGEWHSTYGRSVVNAFNFYPFTLIGDTIYCTDGNGRREVREVFKQLR